MGNYSTLYGSISIKEGKTEELKKVFDKELEELGWDIKFEQMFNIWKKYKTMPYDYLEPNKEYNSFKLLGYPDNFDEFVSIWEKVIKYIDYGTILGDVEDDCFFKIKLNDLDVDGKIKIKMFRFDETKNSHHHEVWHKNVLYRHDSLNDQENGQN